MRRKKQFARRRKNLLIRLAAVVLPMAFAMTALSQTAFAKTYVITDGDRVAAYTTFATDPQEVPNEMGLTLERKDRYTTKGDSAIHISRTQTVRVSHHGEEMAVEATNETVGELLQRLNIGVEAQDVLSHPMDIPVYDGMILRVDRVLQQQETYTSTITHEITYCSDASIPAGEQEVLIEGRDGEILCTADVTYVNGVEKERKVRSEKQTIAPVTEVVAVGTGDPVEAVDPNAMPIIGDGYILLPTGEVLTYTKTDTVRATAYTHTDAGCDRITATGSTVHRGTVAVDPRFIPYGTRMFIVANDGSYVYGIAEAEDCGGAIKRDRMDLYFPTYEECIAFGWRTCTIYFLG